LNLLQIDWSAEGHSDDGGGGGLVVVAISKVYVGDTTQVNWHCQNLDSIKVNFVFSQRWCFMGLVSFHQEKKNIGITIIICV
jgi:hypothetical protein